MPVITRNQSKKIEVSAQSPILKPKKFVTPVEQHVVNVMEKKECPSFIDFMGEKQFYDYIKSSLAKFDIFKTKSEKMKLCLEMFTEINKAVPIIFKNDCRLWSKSWFKFAATAYNKADELMRGFLTNEYDSVESDLVIEFAKCITKSKQMLAEQFKKIKPVTNNSSSLSPFKFSDNIDANSILYQSPFREMYESIYQDDKNSCKIERPKRNVPRVDYIGMDTNEPLGEPNNSKGIWYDNTVKYDSDYIPEEDEESDSDDEEFMRKNSFVTKRLKRTETVNNHKQISKSFRELHPRNIRKINYSGMDMTDEDKGSVYVCQVKWTNRVPKY